MGSHSTTLALYYQYDKQSNQIFLNIKQYIRCVDRELTQGDAGKEGERDENRLHCECEKDEDVVGYDAQGVKKKTESAVAIGGLFISCLHRFTLGKRISHFRAGLTFISHMLALAKSASAPSQEVLQRWPSCRTYN